MKNTQNSFLIAFLIIVSFFSSCTGRDESLRMVRKPLEVNRVKGVRITDVHSVVVLPFERSLAVKLSNEELVGLSERLVTAFQRNTGVSVLNVEDPKLASKAAEIFSRDTLPAESRVRMIGESTGAMGVLRATLTRYEKERPGTKDARVGFSLSLLDTTSATEIWSATFDRGFEPLTNNVLRLGDALKGGLREKGATQLVEQGFLEASRNFEKSRQQEAVIPLTK